jgi:hypothetical protein
VSIAVAVPSIPRENIELILQSIASSGPASNPILLELVKLRKDMEYLVLTSAYPTCKPSWNQPEPPKNNRVSTDEKPKVVEVSEIPLVPLKSEID